MSNLKAIGSEKLTGQNKLNRIMEIARFNEVIPTKINETSKSEYSVSLADGYKYEIVRERQGYIIKKTMSESETDYIEPMKNRKYYSSYSQAFKRLNLVAGELNRINENDEGVSLYGEQKRFTLKTPKPAPEAAPEMALPPSAPPAVPSPELPPSPVGDDAPVEDDIDMSAQEVGPEGDEEVSVDVDSEESGNEEEEVSFKTIQKLTGKLTQKIRVLDNKEGMTSEDVKYVINMVLSSLDLKTLSEEDKEDIMNKFEDAEGREEGDDLGDDMGGEDMTDDSEVEDIQSDMDVPVDNEMAEDSDFGNGAILDHIFRESKVDKVISKYFEVTKQEIIESSDKKAQKQIKIKSDVKKKMDSVIKLTETIEQELAAKKFLEKNSNYNFIGITNKKNLVFENNGIQKRISTEGNVI